MPKKKQISPASNVPTMHDVAGVSQCTVSRVLNQNSTSVLISEETRQKIREAVKQLGWG
jgi:DNA-binding LacI/PurR family transcriptional regulator